MAHPRRGAAPESGCLEKEEEKEKEKEESKEKEEEKEENKEKEEEKERRKRRVGMPAPLAELRDRAPQQMAAQARAGHSRACAERALTLA